MGLRKVFGAYRFQLIRQFLGESVLVTVMALVIALAAISLISPYFDSFAGKPVTTQFAGSGLWWLVLPAGALLVGLLSGSYPAMLLSALQPVQGVKGGPQLAVAGGLSRKILVVIQFTISIAMIISTGILFNQMAYLQSKHPGFDKDRVIVIPTFNDVLDNFQPWKEALLQHTGVAGVTHSNSLPGLAGNIGQVSTGTVQRVDDPGNTRHDVQGLNVALDFVETLGMELLAGRSHSGAMSRDSEALNIVINETAQRVLGWNTPEEAIGQEVLFGRGWTGTVIGVVRDFHFRSMHLKIEPLVLFLGGGLHLAVRLHPGDPGQALDYIENQWLRMFPDFPFAYTFLDENIERLYRSEVRIGYVFGVFALVAVFLACLGLFALVSFTMERRTREIGVRKALGASVQQVLALLSGEFVGLVLIANVLAWPAAWLTMQRWLESLRLPHGDRLGDLFSFRRHRPADHAGHHRLSRGSDRTRQSGGRAEEASEPMKHVVIVGGGFAGLNAAKKLGGRRDVRVTLVDRQNYHLFQPLLYQVAMAGLSPADIATPIRSVLARCQEHLGAAGIGRRCRLAGADRIGGFRPAGVRLPAALLRVDPELFRPRRLGGARAEPEDDPTGHRDPQASAKRLRSGGTDRRPRDSAGSYADLCRNRRRTHRRRAGGRHRGNEPFHARKGLPPHRHPAYAGHPDRVRSAHPLDVLRAAGGPGGPGPGKARRAGLAQHPGDGDRRTRRAGGPGAYCVLNGALGGRAYGGLKSRFRGPRRAMNWMGGMRRAASRRTAGAAQSRIRGGRVTLDRGGRVVVDEDLSIPGHPNVFVAGRPGLFHPPDRQSPLPGTAPVAIQQGRFVARTICRDLAGKQREPFRFVDRGQMATIGRSRAVAEIGRLQVLRLDSRGSRGWWSTSISSWVSRTDCSSCCIGPGPT